MMDGENDMKYAQILKDDFSGYAWVIPTTEATAEVTADLLIRWFPTFGLVQNGFRTAGRISKMIWYNFHEIRLAGRTTTL